MKKPRFLPFLVFVTDFFSGHPVLARIYFFPWNRIPFIHKRLPVIVQGIMGVSAFDMHDMNRRKGRIGIGGVDETLWYSGIFPVLKRRLADKMGEREKDRFLYELAEEMGHKEADTALTSGKWVPRSFQTMFEEPDLLVQIRKDRKLRELFEKTIKLAVRLILNEGGWGNVRDFDLSSDPIRVEMEYLQEALQAGSSDRQVCYYMAGYLAGFAGRMLHCEAVVEETECIACGGKQCVFEIRLNNPS